MLALFCNLIALILGYNCEKVTRIVTKVKYGEVWGKLGKFPETIASNIWD